MALYFKDIEITNIDNLVPQTELDITDMWFGSTNVYTVWQTYEGTLPATINANGNNMRQYQVWGNTGGVGDKTVNLFDKDTTLDGYEITENKIQINENWCVSDFIPVESNTLYKSQNSGNVALSYTDKSSQPTRLSGILVTNGVKTLSETKFIRMNCRISQKARCIVAKRDDLPETFVPFGYEVDMGVKSGNLLNFSTVQNNITIDSVTGRPVAYNGRIATLTPIDVSTVSAVTIRYNDNYDDGLFTYFIYSVLTADGTMLIRKTNKRNGDTIEIPTEGVNLYISWYRTINITTDNITQVMVSINPSDKYQPYSNTTMPIYIGDEPLDKDEYVDYTQQKIYRMVDGVLTPTDPPVPLPALPTCEGTTVINYEGQSVAPEKVLLTYRKEGF